MLSPDTDTDTRTHLVLHNRTVGGRCRIRVGNACGTLSTSERREDLPSKIEAAPSSSTELRRSRHEPPRLEPARCGASRLKRLDGLIQINIAFAIAFWLYGLIYILHMRHVLRIVRIYAHCHTLPVTLVFFSSREHSTSQILQRYHRSPHLLQGAWSCWANPTR